VRALREVFVVLVVWSGQEQKNKEKKKKKKMRKEEEPRTFSTVSELFHVHGKKKKTHKHTGKRKLWERKKKKTLKENRRRKSRKRHTHTPQQNQPNALRAMEEQQTAPQQEVKGETSVKPAVEETKKTEQTAPAEKKDSPDGTPSSSATSAAKKKKKKKKKPASQSAAQPASQPAQPAAPEQKPTSTTIPATPHIIRLLGTGSFKYGQTNPPTIPVIDLFRKHFPEGGYPAGEIQQYRDEYVWFYFFFFILLSLLFVYFSLSQ
jgi:hypothetical protein